MYIAYIGERFKITDKEKHSKVETNYDKTCSLEIMDRLGKRNIQQIITR